MKVLNFYKLVVCVGCCLLFQLLYFGNSRLVAQWEPLYRVYLRDKLGSVGHIHPDQYLSPEALKRRQRYHVPLNDQDVPVSKAYLDSLSRLGLKIVCTSRWLNTVVVSGMDSVKQERVEKLSFVKQIAQVADTSHRSNWQRLRKFYVGSAGLRGQITGLWPQITLNQGNFLHENGYLGEGMRIAVIDAGFDQATECISLHELFAGDRLLGTRDFVYPGVGVFTASFHGTAVLSIMAASASDSLVGVAPMASYLLLRSEDVAGEYPAEEDFWVAAAEYADSIGVDIINTSLGYTQFDNPVYNYRYSDMNGVTAHISQAASIAASKGILVVVSVGNDGNDDWRYLGAPADAKGILAVGALDAKGMRAPFSSIGPTPDGRIKPEVMAMGRAVRSEYAPNDFRLVSGTSFSAPIISGLAACLWQAYPHLPASKIREAIVRSSSQYHTPDSLMGYGIPDFSKAFYWLQQHENTLTPFSLYPNPCRSQLTLEFYNPDRDPLLITCITPAGQQVFSRKSYVVQKITFVSEIQHLPAGIYMLKISSNAATYCLKFLKL